MKKLTAPGPGLECILLLAGYCEDIARAGRIRTLNRRLHYLRKVYIKASYNSKFRASLTGETRSDSLKPRSFYTKMTEIGLFPRDSKTRKTFYEMINSWFTLIAQRTAALIGESKDKTPWRETLEQNRIKLDSESNEDFKVMRIIRNLFENNLISYRVTKSQVGGDHTIMVNLGRHANVACQGGSERVFDHTKQWSGRNSFWELRLPWLWRLHIHEKGLSVRPSTKELVLDIQDNICIIAKQTRGFDLSKYRFPLEKLKKEIENDRI